MSKTLLKKLSLLTAISAVSFASKLTLAATGTRDGGSGAPAAFSSSSFECNQDDRPVDGDYSHFALTEKLDSDLFTLRLSYASGGLRPADSPTVDFKNVYVGTDLKCDTPAIKFAMPTKCVNEADSMSFTTTDFYTDSESKVPAYKVVEITSPVLAEEEFAPIAKVKDGVGTVKIYFKYNTCITRLKR